MERAVTTSRGEGSVYWVEGDSIDTVDVGDISSRASRGWLVTMAFKAEIVGRVLFFDVLNSTSPFDTTDSETRCISERRHDSGLELQGRLHRLVKLFGRIKVDDVDVPISGADDQEFVFDIHCVHPFLTLECGNWILLSQIPVFDCLVPGPSDEDLLIVDISETTCSNRLLMSDEGLRGHIA